MFLQLLVDAGIQEQDVVRLSGSLFERWLSWQVHPDAVVLWVRKHLCKLKWIQFDKTRLVKATEVGRVVMLG